MQHWDADAMKMLKNQTNNLVGDLLLVMGKRLMVGGMIDICRMGMEQSREAI